jgi:hypothetical protein
LVLQPQPRGGIVQGGRDTKGRIERTGLARLQRTQLGAKDVNAAATVALFVIAIEIANGSKEKDLQSVRHDEDDDEGLPVVAKEAQTDAEELPGGGRYGTLSATLLFPARLLFAFLGVDRADLTSRNTVGVSIHKVFGMR